jgi:hypothetical protein
MLIAYDTKFRLEADKNQTTELYFGTHSNGLISLSTKNFRIDFEEGRASIHLSRHLDAKEMRELGQALLAAADETEQHEKAWVTVTSNYGR